MQTEGEQKPCVCSDRGPQTGLHITSFQTHSDLTYCSISGVMNVSWSASNFPDVKTENRPSRETSVSGKPEWLGAISTEEIGEISMCSLRVRRVFY